MNTSRKREKINDVKIYFFMIGKYSSDLFNRIIKGVLYYFL